MDRPLADTRRRRLSAEAHVTWVIWLTYGCFYFARQNTSAAVKGMLADGYDRLDIAWILGALKITYGIGQLVNGQLAERLSPRKMLAIGMFGSAALNVAFGFSSGAYFLTFIWACNGWCQSLGWTPCVRVIANWIPPTRRGRALGIVATSYQLLNGVTYMVAGLCVDEFGWRGAFWFPPLILAAAGVHMLFFLKEKPDQAGEMPADAPKAAATGHWTETIRATLSNPALWILAIAMFLLDAVRYFFNDWGMDHLSDVQQDSAFMTSVKYAVLPAGGIVGSLTSGWLTDRYFAGRRTPVLFGFLLLLGVLTIAYDHVTQYSITATVFLLFALGFATFGPHILLVGTAPADLAKHGTAAAASGFVNFMGYVGAFAQGFVTGLLKQNYDWQTAIYFWAGAAFVAALVVVPLWRVGPRHRE